MKIFPGFFMNPGIFLLMLRNQPQAGVAAGAFIIPSLPPRLRDDDIFCVCPMQRAALSPSSATFPLSRRPRRIAARLFFSSSSERRVFFFRFHAPEARFPVYPSIFKQVFIVTKIDMAMEIGYT